MSLTMFNAGERHNVITSTGDIRGSLRSFEDGLSEEIKQEYINILEGLKSKYEYTYDLVWNIIAPVLNNTEKEA